MKMKKALLCASTALLLALPAQAFDLHVRDDDTGAMTQVDGQALINAVNDPNCVDCIVLDWSTIGSWDTEAQGVTWGASLAGMTEGCNFNSPTSRSGINGELNGNLTHPTLPLVAQDREDGGHTFTYNGFFDETSYSRRGCEPPVDGKWGESSWVIVFDQPRTAFYMTLKIHDASAGERYHLEFWCDDMDGDGLADKCGHQDIINSATPQVEYPNTFAWTSTVPVLGFSAWPVGPGVGFAEIGLGEAPAPEQPMTLEERVQDIEDCLNAQVDFGCLGFLGL